MDVAKIATNVVSSVSNSIKPSKLIGLDYSDVDDFIRSDFSKSALALAAKEGKLTPDMIEQMILQRLPKAIKQAELFAQEHPELSKEDITQDLIEHVVKLANGYKGQNSGNFNQYSWLNERRFLESLLKAQAKDSEYIVKGVDLSKIPDDFLDRRLEVAKIQGISDAIETLTLTEQEVLESIHGLDGKEQKSLSEIARDFGVTRERVRTKEDKAIKKLRHPRVTSEYRANIKVAANGDLQDKMAYLADKGMLSEDFSFEPEVRRTIIDGGF